MPCALWLVVLLHMVCGWKGRIATEFEREYEALRSGSQAGGGSPKAGGGSKKGLGTAAAAQPQAQENAPVTSEEQTLAPGSADSAMAKTVAAAESIEKVAGAVEDASEGDMLASAQLAAQASSAALQKLRGKNEKPPSAFSRKMAAFRANPWFKLLMWMRTHATGLVVQFALNFCGSTESIILTPILLGVLIALSAIFLPLFQLRGLKLENTKMLVETAITLGYVALATPSFVRVFIEAEPAGRLITQFTAITDSALFSLCVTTAMPLITLASSSEERPSNAPARPSSPQPGLSICPAPHRSAVCCGVLLPYRVLIVLIMPRVWCNAGCAHPQPPPVASIPSLLLLTRC